MVGLAGDDVLDASSAQGSMDMLGGTGNDTYIMGRRGFLYIDDRGGTDTLKLPYSSAEFSETTKYSGSHLTVDGDSYLATFNGGLSTVFIKDCFGAGAIEYITLADGKVLSFDGLMNSIGKSKLQQKSLYEAFSASGEEAFRVYLKGAAMYDAIANFEAAAAQHPTPAWFDESTYLQNKAAESGAADLNALATLFTESGFPGRDGRLYYHFIQHGQWEDVSPTSLFDADYYYKAKAANADGIAFSQATNAQAQAMRSLIHKAGLNAWLHYERYGTREGIDASANFDTSAYMEAKLAQMRQDDPNYSMEQLFRAFESAGMSAVEHYEAYGKDEGVFIVGATVPTADAAPA